MASINYAFKEIISKIVYYGPGLSGKTTNLQFVFKKVPAETRGELISLATDADRTLYFDFLPVNVGTIQGFATKFQLYTVPGQVYYNATRKLVLRGVDGLVFVIDSQREKLEENIDSLQNLKDNLQEYGYELDQIPMVLQYNKRDLPNIMDINELQSALNPGGLPYFEAVAVSGEGVFKTLKAISKMVLDNVRKSSSETPKIIKSQPKAESLSSRQPQPVAATSSVIERSGEQDEIEVTRSSIKQKGAAPKIVTESDTHTNVVVSDTPDQKPATDSVPVLKEEAGTIEKSVLKEDVEEPTSNLPIDRKHPDILDDSDGESGGRSIYDKSSRLKSFDEEATQVSSLSQKAPLPLGKPQMAESRKVKGRKGRSGFFGLFRRKKN